MEFLAQVKNIAVVGLSNKEERASYQVAKYLQEHGFKIIPVNPTIQEVLGEPAYPSISDIPSHIPVDLVDVFRKSENVVPVVEEALQIGIKLIWLQEGVINQEAAELAKKANAKIVMDQCIKKVYQGM